MKKTAEKEKSRGCSGLGMAMEEGFWWYWALDAVTSNNGAGESMLCLAWPASLGPAGASQVLISTSSHLGDLHQSNDDKVQGYKKTSLV